MINFILEDAMKQTVTVDAALNLEETESTASAFGQCISEIDRHLEEMRGEKKAMRTISERTDATLAKISEILTLLKAA
jgi:hypothetical protein